MKHVRLDCKIRAHDTEQLDCNTTALKTKHEHLDMKKSHLIFCHLQRSIEFKDPGLEVSFFCAPLPYESVLSLNIQKEILNLIFFSVLMHCVFCYSLFEQRIKICLLVLANKGDNYGLPIVLYVM